MVNSAFLDGEDVLYHYADKEFDNGYSFGWGVRMVGVVAALFGISVMFFGGFGFVLGPIFIIGGGFVATSRIGTEVCFETRHVRDYHKVFWRKHGVWVSTHHFPDICILKLGKTDSVEDALGAQVNRVDVSRNEIFLMTEDHRRRLLLKACDTMEEAVGIAELMSQKLDKRLTHFSPKVSSHSMKRRR